jgi:hypothetical protein
MPQFVLGTWVTHDSMNTDPNTFCPTATKSPATPYETINDWTV